MRYGLNGKWFAATVVQNGRTLAQSYYQFERGDRKFVITCSCLSADRDKFDPSFRKSVNSFRLD